ncbi:hypothetical protein [Halosimplex halophilum]|uniref:hypothetical protein n=1 Tax=Halosimplex halophilum TaxID=2559572 RepID=UPI00107FA9D7|nr:hypothetical protein [Halosimplex halophilum]
MSRDDAVGDGSEAPASDAAAPGSEEAAIGVETNTAGADGSPDADERSRDDLVVELERLRERNQRLRATYERARTAQYRRTALGLAALGLVGVAGAGLLPSLRDVLLVLGAIGLFGGLLTYYLTPERFVAADVTRSVYETLAGDRVELVAELGLADERVYVPVGESESRVRLFVPQYEDYAVPGDDALADSLVVPDAEGGRGAAFTPTGAPLYESFRESLPGEPADRPAALVEQVGDALVEQFELVDHARADAGERGRLTVGVGETVYGPADGFDAPVASLYAVALARRLERPVRLDADPTEGRDSYLLTYRWDADESSE